MSHLWFPQLLQYTSRTTLRYLFLVCSSPGNKENKSNGVKNLPLYVMCVRNYYYYYNMITTALVSVV